MQTHLGHLVFGIQSTNVGFYRDLLQFLGWETLYDGEGMLGVGGAHGVSMWFGSAPHNKQNDYDSPGLNHVAISTAAQADVDTVAAYLRERGVDLLFETPRHRPDFAFDPESTYYQIMFESPDRILFEIVYTGPKSA